MAGSIVDYATLQTAVADWLNRSDLTARVPDFIGLAEAQIKRRLRRTTVRATVTFSEETYTLPSDCAEIRSLRLVTGSPQLDQPIPVVTQEVLSEYRARHAAVAGRPVAAAILTGKLMFAPVPDQAYAAEIIYFSSLTPLTATNTTNVVLTEAPDLYLYGALKEAEPFLEHDDRVALWTTKFESALGELDTVREREEYQASLRPMRLPRVFG